MDAVAIICKYTTENQIKNWTFLDPEAGKVVSLTTDHPIQQRYSGSSTTHSHISVEFDFDILTSY